MIALPCPNVSLAGLVRITEAVGVAVAERPTDERSRRHRAYAPPTRVHIHDANGFHKPFIYKQILEHRLMRRYADDRSAPVPIEFFTRGTADGGRLRGGRGQRPRGQRTTRRGRGPLLLLGADALGRDIFSRLVLGARLSLGVALVGVLGAILIGAFVGSVAGTIGGRMDDVLMTISDFVLVLPGAYLVLVLRGVLPLVLSTSSVFWLMATLFAATAWPHVARGVRAIVAAERAREYAEAARAAGAGPLRLAAQLLPAARGFLGVEIVLLLPALLIAEATISFLGLGFPAPVASWGTMLQDAANVNVMSHGAVDAGAGGGAISRRAGGASCYWAKRGAWGVGEGVGRSLMLSRLASRYRPEIEVPWRPHPASQTSTQH